MPVLMLINLKGGVAKTTSAVAIAECLASAGHRTLVIDADHQSMAGEMLLGEDRYLRLDKARRTLHDLLSAMLEPEFSADRIGSFVVDNASMIGGGLPRLSVIPCSFRIDDFSRSAVRAKRADMSSEEFNQLVNRHRRQMRKWVESNFDFTIIDSPPSLPFQIQFMLSITDAYIIPCVPDRLSTRGALYLIDRIRSLRFKAAGLGTLWTLYREIDLHRKAVEMAATRQAPLDRLPPPFRTRIPNAAAIGGAPEKQAPKSFRNKYSTEFARKFEDLCDEIVGRLEWQPSAPSAATVRHQV